MYHSSPNTPTTPLSPNQYRIIQTYGEVSPFRPTFPINCIEKPFVALPSWVRPPNLPPMVATMTTFPPQLLISDETRGAWMNSEEMEKLKALTSAELSGIYGKIIQKKDAAWALAEDFDGFQFFIAEGEEGLNGIPAIWVYPTKLISQDRETVAINVQVGCHSPSGGMINILQYVIEFSRDTSIIPPAIFSALGVEHFFSGYISSVSSALSMNDAVLGADAQAIEASANISSAIGGEVTIDLGYGSPFPVGSIGFPFFFDPLLVAVSEDQTQVI